MTGRQRSSLAADRGPLWRNRLLLPDLRVHDPSGDGLRHAARAAVAIVAATALGIRLGGGEVALFAVFGTFALLVLVDFPGTRRTRAVSYLGLSVVGTALVCLGTWVAGTPWLAVSTMFLVTLLVTFSGVLSATFAAAGRAALMALILPVTAPTGILAQRLLGWGVAVALSVPTALLLFPPRHSGRIRAAAVGVCTALADRLEGRGSPDDVERAMRSLRHGCVASAYRPVRLAAGSRALVRLVDELQWLVDRSQAAYVTDPLGWGPSGAVLRAAAAALRSARASGSNEAFRHRLVSTLQTARRDADEHLRAGVARMLRAPGSVEAVDAWQRLVVRHTVGAATLIAGQAVLVSAQADARPVLAKVLGRGLPHTDPHTDVLPDRAAAARITEGLLSGRSAILRIGLRTAVALTLAVALGLAMPVSHAFWVALGVLSVLRASALSTGSTVLRAMLGTVLGFGVGVLVVVVIGASPALLWTALPLAAFLAAFVPEAVSFTAGQAAFTAMILVLFNILSPGGWQIGVVRVEDVALGCAVAVVTSALMWPRGLATLARSAIAEDLDAATRYLDVVVCRLTAPDAVQDDPARLRQASRDAARRADDAMRQYLNDLGADPVDERDRIIRAANGSARVRQAADAIGQLSPPPAAATAPLRAVLGGQLDAVVNVLRARHVGNELDDTAGLDDMAGLDARLVAGLRSAKPPSLEAMLPIVTAAAYLRELYALGDLPAGLPAGEAGGVAPTA